MCFMQGLACTSATSGIDASFSCSHEAAVSQLMAHMEIRLSACGLHLVNEHVLFVLLDIIRF